MKKLITSITTAIILTVVLLLIVWNIPPRDTEKNDDSGVFSSDPSLSTQSSLAPDNNTSECTSFEESFICFEDEYGPLFLACKDIVSTGTYKLVVVRQKRFGGNSVPVTTTAYYGAGFINVIEQEGHALTSETLITEGGTYLFDSSAECVYLLKNYSMDTETITTNGIRFTNSGEILVGTTLYDYESYTTVDGKRIDYLFLGGNLKKIKIYDEEGDYEIIGAELSSDISGARSALPENTVIIEMDY